MIRAVSFFENEYYAVDAAKATVKKLPLPLSADVKGMFDSALVATLRQDYVDPASGDHFGKGALMVFRDGHPPQSLLCAGAARQRRERWRWAAMGSMPRSPRM